jgi:hypothetical protein
LGFGACIRDGHSRMLARYFHPSPGALQRTSCWFAVHARTFDRPSRHARRPLESALHELISIPVTNTSAPPNPTCRAAEGMDVSMLRCRIQVMVTVRSRPRQGETTRRSRSHFLRRAVKSLRNGTKYFPRGALSITKTQKA